MSEVYGVHVIRSEEIQATDVIFTLLAAAEEHAKVVSRDTGVLAAAVTTYVLDELGRRTPTALFVAGKRQERPYISDNREIWANNVRR